MKEASLIGELLLYVARNESDVAANLRDFLGGYNAPHLVIELLFKLSDRLSYDRKIVERVLEKVLGS